MVNIELTKFDNIDFSYELLQQIVYFPSNSAK